MNSKTILAVIAAVALQACTFMNAQYYIDFGSVQLTKSKDSTFVLTNTLPIPIGVNSITPVNNPSDFAIISGGGPVTVQPSGTHTAVLRFSPSALGVRTDSLLVTGVFPGSPVYVELVGEGIALPVELESFSAVWNNAGVTLFWLTSSETNNLGFEVQRGMSAGSGGAVYSTIAFVPGAGSSASGRSYSYADAAGPAYGGELFYRLLQTDTDGSIHPSRPLRVAAPESTEGADFLVSPNPNTGLLNVTFTLPSSEHVKLEIADMSGRIVSTLADGTFETGSHSRNFSLGALPAGVYMARLAAVSFERSRRFFLIR